MSDFNWEQEFIMIFFFYREPEQMHVPCVTVMAKKKIIKGSEGI